MDSKMRPIWIVFQNEDSNGDNVAEIFKNGDGKHSRREACTHICDRLQENRAQRGVRKYREKIDRFL